MLDSKLSEDSHRPEALQMKRSIMTEHNSKAVELPEFFVGCFMHFPYLALVYRIPSSWGFTMLPGTLADTGSFPILPSSYSTQSPSPSKIFTAHLKRLQPDYTKKETQHPDNITHKDADTKLITKLWLPSKFVALEWLWMPLLMKDLAVSAINWKKAIIPNVTPLAIFPNALHARK